MAVGSGAFILGKAGMLDGIESTTTSSLRPQLATMFPATRMREQRFFDTGKIMTTAGLSAGRHRRRAAPGRAAVGQAAGAGRGAVHGVRLAPGSAISTGQTKQNGAEAPFVIAAN